jgi:hypothetical protein
MKLHERLSLVKNSVEELDQQESSRYGTPGGPTGGDGMEARVAKLESAVEYIQSDLKEIKADTREIKRDAREDFRVLAGLIIVAIVALAGLMAKGFHWL